MGPRVHTLSGQNQGGAVIPGGDAVGRGPVHGGIVARIGVHIGKATARGDVLRAERLPDILHRVGLGAVGVGIEAAANHALVIGPVCGKLVLLNIGV